MIQPELLTRVLLEQLVGREMTVSFQGAEILVCTLTVDDHKATPCVPKKSYLEPFSYKGILERISDCYLVTGRYPNGTGFAVPAIPVEEGKEPYNHSIEVGERKFVYSIERK